MKLMLYCGHKSVSKFSFLFKVSKVSTFLLNQMKPIGKKVQGNSSGQQYEGVQNKMFLARAECIFVLKNKKSRECGICRQSGAQANTLALGEGIDWNLYSQFTPLIYLFDNNMKEFHSTLKFFPCLLFIIILPNANASVKVMSTSSIQGKCFHAKCFHAYGTGCGIQCSNLSIGFPTDFPTLKSHPPTSPWPAF